MKLHPPFFISSRLMPALRAEGLTISLEYAKRSGEGHRIRYAYALDFNDGTEYEADDLQSGNFTSCGIQDGFESLLSFLEAAAEHYAACRMGDLQDYEPMFTKEIDAKLYEVGGDEIGMLRCEIEETTNLIEE